MDLLQIAFRIVHIGAASAWVGGAALFFFYLEPAMVKLGPDAEKFIDEVVNRRKVPLYFFGASTLTVIFGALLYWRDSNGLQGGAWIGSPTGLAFTIGGVSGLLAWAGGNLLIPRTIIGLTTMGGELRKAAGPPPAALIERMHHLQGRLRAIGLVDIVLLAIAIVGMASPDISADTATGSRALGLATRLACARGASDRQRRASGGRPCRAASACRSIE